MPRPSSPRARRGDSRKRVRDGGIGGIPVLPAAVLTLIVAGFALATWAGRQASVPTDPETLCRTDLAPPVVHAVLIDVTDAFSEGERLQVLQEIERLRLDLERFGLLELYTIQPAGMTHPLLALCNPGRGQDMNSLYQNPVLAEKRWRSGFQERVSEVLDQVVSTGDSGSSPIMESVRGLATRSFGGADRDGSRKRLTVFSDLLQHAPGDYSHYRRPLMAYEDFASTRVGHATRVNLTGVDVDIHYIARPDTHHLQGSDHQKFWLAYFAASGASVQRFKKVFGD